MSDSSPLEGVNAPGLKSPARNRRAYQVLDGRVHLFIELPKRFERTDPVAPTGRFALTIRAAPS
jgi:hypothetical protein